MTTRADDMAAEAEHWAQQARSPLWQDQDHDDTWRACLWAGIKAAVVMIAAVVIVAVGFSL